jgi:S1-C subfamily serine protease
MESVDGEPLDNLQELNLRLYRALPGAGLKLGMLRDGQRFDVSVKTREHASATSKLAAAVRQRDLIPQLGAFVVDMDKDLAWELDQVRGKRGVLIAAVLGDAPALGEDLQAGDIIYRMNRQAVTDSAKLRELIHGMKPGDPIALQLERDGRLRFVTSEIP